jgi:DNA-directed RNA polymerase specialized sigma24 family protein
MPGLLLAEIDPEELFLRLVHHACALFGVFPGTDYALQGDGRGPEDLAMTVIERFLDPDDKTVQWSAARGEPTLPTVLAYLKRVLGNDFYDLKRQKRYKTTVIASAASTDKDGEPEIGLDAFCSRLESPQGAAIRNSLRDQLLASVADDPDVQELLMVQLDPEGYQAFTNQDLAALFDVTISEIVNRKKRLSRRLTTMLKKQQIPAK